MAKYIGVTYGAVCHDAATLAAAVVKETDSKEQAMNLFRYFREAMYDDTMKAMEDTTPTAGVTEIQPVRSSSSSLGDTLVPGGSNAGMTLAGLYDKNPGKVRWFRDNYSNKAFASLCEEYLKTVE